MRTGAPHMQRARSSQIMSPRAASGARCPLPRGSGRCLPNGRPEAACDLRWREATVSAYFSEAFQVFLDRLLSLGKPKQTGPFRVDNVSPIVVPESVPLERDVPEATRQIFAGRLQRYDYKTVFYDAFDDGHRVVLSGPPLMNLRPALDT